MTLRERVKPRTVSSELPELPELVPDGMLGGTDEERDPLRPRTGVSPAEDEFEGVEC